MKILLVLNDLRKGNGVASCIMQYYDLLLKAEIKIDFLLLNKVDSPWMNTVVKHGNIFYLPKSKIKYSPKVFMFLNHLFSTNCYQLIHVNIPGPYGSIILECSKRKGIGARIYHTHNPNNNNNFRTYIESIIYSWLCKNKSTYLLACSESAGKSSFGHSKFTVLKNRIDSKKFIFNLSNRTKVRNELGLADDTFLFGTVGRLELQKNPKYAMDCFKQYHKYNSNSYFVWVGAGSMIEELKQYALHLEIDDCVNFVGNKTNVSEWYSAFDCFILPSKFEGFGIVFLEAMANGLYCFASMEVPTDFDKFQLIKRIDLKSSPEYWAKAIMATNLDYDRLEKGKIILNSEYDINHGCNDLICIYKNAIRK